MNIIACVISFCVGGFLGVFSTGLVAGATRNEHVAEEVDKIRKKLEADLCEIKK